MRLYQYLVMFLISDISFSYQIAGHPGQQVQLLSTTSLNQARSQGATHTSQTATLSNKLNVSSPASTTTSK